MGRLVNDQALEELRQILAPEQIFADEPMSRHTTFRVGGPAELLIRPKRGQIAEVISLLRRRDIPYAVIGNGSNLLVSDGGFSGVVIEFAKQASAVVIDGTKICAEAGAMLSKVASMAGDASLAGMEFAAGIPGTVGGAVCMNAGAYGGEMSQILTEVAVLTPEGSERTIPVSQLDLGYRHSCIEEQGYIVLSAVLELERGERETIASRMEQLRQKRAARQPLEYPSAGSTFKRPDGLYAGKLIMDAGLRGYAIGGAQVSEKHCGFVINKGGASAADIAALMRHIQEEVARQFGVTLEAEVRRLGEFA